MNRSKFLLISILTILLLGLTSWPADLPARPENNSSFKGNSKSVGSHAPIYIEGNDALATFIEDEGLSGEGTPASPYIIENFIINASTAFGIEIRFTDAYLIIQNCLIEGGAKDGNGSFPRITPVGILLNNTAHVTIRNNLLPNNPFGIYLWKSTNNTLSGNSLIYNFYGIALVNSSNNILSENSGYKNIAGIGLFFLNKNTLLGNSINNKTLLGNSENECLNGIYLYSSGDNLLSGNKVRYNGWVGIWLDCSKNNTLLGNSVNNNKVSGNSTIYNGNGIYLANSSSNILSGNNVSYNYWVGIGLIFSSNNNTIYFNDIYGNTKCQAYEKYDCMDNRWDNGTTGNYWGDDYTNNYTSATNDGKIWNISYEIVGDGNGVDHFPLVNSITTDYTTDETPGFSFMVVIFISIFLLIRRKNQ
ncbi:MAG: nitrous oxide reductase family maturation protein NosD [Promethearchaeota archaeon]